MFGVDIELTMNKADRLIYGESVLTHLMVFTAVTCDVSFEVFFVLYLTFMKFCSISPSGKWTSHELPSGKFVG